MAYVYRHIRLDKNEPFYIGVGHLHSDDHYKRKGRTYGRNDIWKKIANKTKYSIEIILDDLTYEDALQKEIEFIKLYGRINTETGTLANLTEGGEGNMNCIASKETREKLSKVWKGRKQTPEHIKNKSAALIGKKRPDCVIDKMRKTLTGRKLSEDHKVSISISLQGDKNPFYGKHHSEETLKLISKQVIDEETGIIYISIKEAASCLNLCYGVLKRRLSGKVKNTTTLRYYINQ